MIHTGLLSRRTQVCCRLCGFIGVKGCRGLRDVEGGVSGFRGFGVLDYRVWALGVLSNHR